MFQVQMQQHVRVCSMRGMVITVVGEGCVHMYHLTVFVSQWDFSFLSCLCIHSPAMDDGGCGRSCLICWY